MLVEEYKNGASTHLTKEVERLVQLERLITNGNLGLNDLDIAEAIKEDLANAAMLFD